MTSENSIGCSAHDFDILADPQSIGYLTAVLPNRDEDRIVLKTKLSSKGQVVLPREVRERRQWVAGSELIVEEKPEGVLLRKVPVFEVTNVDDVVGFLKYDGPHVSDADIKEAVRIMAVRRYERSEKP